MTKRKAAPKVALMDDVFPFVSVPANSLAIFGQRDRAARVYRREGSEVEIAAWYDKLVELFGDMVSPGGVTMFARVSRAAVYQAINEGRLTAFGFHVITETRGVFGFKKRRRETPYVFIPVSECKAWGEIVDAKIKAKSLTAEEEPGRVSDRAIYRLAGGIERGKYPRRRGGNSK